MTVCEHLRELGKLASNIAAQEREVEFFLTYIEVCGPPELKTLPAGAHPVASLLCHAAEYGATISLPRGMGKEDR